MGHLATEFAGPAFRARTCTSTLTRAGTRSFENHEAGDRIMGIGHGCAPAIMQPLADSLGDSSVTLMVFSATHELRLGLQELTLRFDWRRGVVDSFSLLVILGG